MAEYIDRDEAIESLKKDIMGGLNYGSILNSIPTADVQPVKQGCEYGKQHKDGES